MVGSSRITNPSEDPPRASGESDVSSSNRTVNSGVLWLDSLDSMRIPKGCHPPMTYNTNRIRTVGPVNEYHHGHSMWDLSRAHRSMVIPSVCCVVNSAPQTGHCACSANCSSQACRVSSSSPSSRSLCKVRLAGPVKLPSQGSVDKSLIRDLIALC